MQKDGEYRIYAIYTDIKGNPSDVIGYPLPVIPDQTEAVIAECGETQVILQFNPDETCILSIEGSIEDEHGANYQIFFEKTLSLDAARPVIENVILHTEWYDDYDFRV